MNTAGAGRVVFAATLVALGVAGLAKGHLVAVWQPVPEDVPLREGLVWLSVLASLLAGLGLAWRRTAVPAAGLILVVFVLWVLAFRVPVILREPGMGAWENCAENAVMVAGAWALFARHAGSGTRRGLRFALDGPGVRLARIIYGLAMIPFGLAHFVFLEETAAFVPAWLPGHAAWAAGTGFAYVAAGAAVLTDVLAPLAAALSALQMGLFTLLVWVPIVAAGPNDFQLNEILISWALTAAGWVVAESYRGEGRGAS
jgi:uncharacterized membrane protein